MQSPVLFLVFNRPETTRQVFEAIRAAKPPKLYVAADGPRINREGERERCEEVRRIATAVDWDCEVKTLFRKKNLGCKIGVSSGIDWFFEHEEEGIILEDDILPLPTFFEYCDQLLCRYRYNNAVGMISGCNFVVTKFSAKESYFFSRYTHIWGWATWRRAWAIYDVNMVDWPAWRDNGLRIFLNRSLSILYWQRVFDAVYFGKINTWDYQWMFACWKHSMLTALPSKMQIYNLGFGSDATHTDGLTPDYIKNSQPEAIRFPLTHPKNVVRSEKADFFDEKYAFKIGWVQEVHYRVSSIPFIREWLRKVKGQFLSI